MARFAATNDEEAAEIRGNRLAKNTKKANKSAADTFRAYLRRRDILSILKNGQQSS